MPRHTPYNSCIESLVYIPQWSKAYHLTAKHAVNIPGYKTALKSSP